MPYFACVFIEHLKIDLFTSFISSLVNQTRVRRIFIKFVLFGNLTAIAVGKITIGWTLRFYVEHCLWVAANVQWRKKVYFISFEFGNQLLECHESLKKKKIKKVVPVLPSALKLLSRPGSHYFPWKWGVWNSNIWRVEGVWEPDLSSIHCGKFSLILSLIPFFSGWLVSSNLSPCGSTETSFIFHEPHHNPRKSLTKYKRFLF